MNPDIQYKIRVCIGGRYRMNFSEDLVREAEKILSENPRVQVERRGCMNMCEKAPSLEVVDAETAQPIQTHCCVSSSELKKVVEELLNC